MKLDELMPPKPAFHPADNVRICQTRMDTFYNDLLRLFRSAKCLVKLDVGDWVELNAQINADSYTEKGWLIGHHYIDRPLTDAMILEALEKAGGDPVVIENLKRKIAKSNL